MTGFTRAILVCLLMVGCVAFAVADTDKDAENQPETKSEPKTALQFIYADDVEIASYLAKHKCVIGSWELTKQTDYGWEGKLHYACANHRPGGVRYIDGPFKVLKPKGFSPPMTNEFDGFGNHVVLRESKKEGFHEIVAFVVPIDKAKGKRWLEGVGDLNWAGMYQKKYRYEGMVADAKVGLLAKDAKERGEAAYVLSTLGEDGADALPTLLKQFADEKEDAVREAIVRAVATVGFGKSDTIMPTLVNALSDTSKNVQMAAAQAIGFQGPNGKAGIDALIEASTNAPKDVKIEAVRALAHLGVGESRVMEHLKKIADGLEVSTALRATARLSIQQIEANTPVEQED